MLAVGQPGGHQKPCRELFCHPGFVLIPLSGELKTMEARENSQVGVRASPPKQGRFRVPTEEQLQQCLHHGQQQEGLGKQPGGLLPSWGHGGMSRNVCEGVFWLSGAE